MISLNDYLTSSNSYPDRAKSPELTPELVSNANMLLEKVNSLLDDLNVKNVKISSGFRTSAANSSTPNSAKRSAHMSCKAIDIFDDKQQTLGNLIMIDPELLRKRGLFIENLKSTVGKVTNWVHIDMVNRTDRPDRSFKP